MTGVVVGQLTGGVIEREEKVDRVVSAYIFIE